MNMRRRDVGHRVGPPAAVALGIALALVLLASCAPPDHPPALTERDPARWVNPFIGTGGHGHTYPGATVPFGMVQVSPDNGRAGWDWSSGYHWSDSVITGFSHTHLSGTGIGDLLDVLVMPVPGPVDLSVDTLPDGTRPYADRFSHAEEQASPGYYAVTLQRTRIHVELTATTRVGLHRITFPEGSHPGLVVDLGYAENWDRPTDTEFRQISDTLFLGKRYSTGWAKDERVYFALVTSRPVRSVERVGKPPHQRFLLHFARGTGPVLLKVGISYVDEVGALNNVKSEAPGWDFDRARVRAARMWRHELSKVRVRGGTPADRTIFYTALYHTRLAPIVFEDADGRYRGGDGRIHRAEGFTNYSIFSLWDTFRAAHPLNTIIDPARVHDLVASMLAFGDQHGLLPVWLLVGNETNTMTGNHAIPVIVDAVLKGLAGVDPKRALDAVVKSQSSDLRDLDKYRRYGFVPSDLGNQAVTKTLEYGYDDAAVARLAAFVGDSATARTFRARSDAAWRHEYDPRTGFMRGRRSDGTFSEPFDPLLSDHSGHFDYTEGNAWQWAWFVPHDVGGLIEAHGGDHAFVSMLDELFDQDTLVSGKNKAADISGLIGQYAHGNEPSHAIAYLYAWAGRPDRVEDRVRQIMDTQYRADPDGLAGNEDCGQMSAWYVLSALGFYPADPSSGVYVLGVPRFDEASVRVEHGTFTVRVHRDGPDARYIQSVRLKGRDWPFTFIRHEDVADGGLMEIELGPTPSPTWGKEDWTRPPSDSDPESLVVTREEAEKLARR